MITSTHFKATEQYSDQSFSSTRYSINSSDNIVAVGGDWDQLALENNSPSDLLSANIHNRSFWEFVSGDALQHVYRSLMSTVRTGRTLDFVFRCDSPALRRFLKLRMVPGADDGIDFFTETLRTEPRGFQHVFDANAQRTDGLVVACSWCNKLQTGSDLWQEPEDAVEALSLFETQLVPELSHGMCEPCYESVMQKVGRK
jgi:hypothetical protein